MGGRWDRTDHIKGRFFTKSARLPKLENGYKTKEDMIKANLFWLKKHDRGGYLEVLENVKDLFPLMASRAVFRDIVKRM